VQAKEIEGKEDDVEGPTGGPVVREDHGEDDKAEEEKEAER
jgi:hypothetical protein